MDNQNWQLRVELLEKRIELLELEVKQLQSSKTSERSKTSATVNPFSAPISKQQQDEPVVTSDPINLIPASEQSQEEYLNPFIPTGTAKSSEKRNLEHLLARVWLPRVFIIVLLLGVLWGFLAAVANGYLSEEIRCVLGVLLGAGMYYAGIIQLKNNRPGIGKVLLGGSHGVLLLSVTAAHLLYSLIPSVMALILYLLVLALVLWTSIYRRSQTLVVLAIFSGYLIPFLVRDVPANASFIIVYAAIFSITMLLLTARFRYLIAYCFAFCLLHFSLFFIIIITNTNLSALILSVVIAQHLVLFIQYIVRPNMKKDYHSIQFISFALLALWSYWLYIFHTPAIYSYTILAGLISYIVTWFHFNKKLATASADEAPVLRNLIDISVLIVTFAAVLLAFRWGSVHYKAAILFVIGVLSLVMGIRSRYSLQKVIGMIIAGLSGTVIIANYPVKLLSSETLGWSLILIAIPLVYWVLKQSLEQQLSENRTTFNEKTLRTHRFELSSLLWAESVFGLIFLSVIVNLMSEGLKLDLRHFILSAAWLIYAVGAILIGIVFKQSKARLTGMLFLFVVLLKVIFIDLFALSLAIRAVMFIILGGVGIGVSRLLYSGNDGSKH